ncbi:hypothetical protein LCGC14_0799520 [marine sediment metagenome]|uniref:Uncharacterized protein n=1 Tax=marine sediment metagenome TaxID=412755 RepID=A0A0F9Q9Z6_9ZZZZ
MPITPWEEVIGEHCYECGNYASHIYGSIYLCCQCHGGGLLTRAETDEIQHGLLQKQEAQEDDKTKIT